MGVSPAAAGVSNFYKPGKAHTLFYQGMGLVFYCILQKAPAAAAKLCFGPVPWLKHLPALRPVAPVVLWYLARWPHTGASGVFAAGKRNLRLGGYTLVY